MIEPPPLVPRPTLAALVVGCAALAVLPVAVDLTPYAHNLLTSSFIMIAGALAWNWIGGFVGQVSFGHASMFGLGAFVAARMMLSLHWPPQVCWIAGALVAGGFAIVAHPMLRLRGPYFSIATIGFGEISRQVLTYWAGFTGGASGLSLPIDGVLKYQLYWWALAVAALVALGSIVIRRSSLGLKLLAIKADADAAADVGISTTFYQDLIFVLSGTVVGLCGGLYASYFGFIEPTDMLGFDRSITFVLMAVVGGIGTALGPMLGAIVFVLIRTYLLAEHSDFYLGLYGLLLIVIILFEPLGLTGLVIRVRRRV
ncbi:MAG TPA: branched-chain amino acid ABC transporter permease [Kofleriaceae bacterium]|nr:branched-chain amino acid ABC transporter permease [Kofleriaceae bacterium]